MNSTWNRRALAVLAAFVLSAFAHAESAAQPTLVSPPTNAGPAYAMSGAADLAADGYVEEEFFVDGVAAAYTTKLPLAADGRWKAKPASKAPFRTRMLVRRPIDVNRFSGTVFVEWLNVTAGSDGAPDWVFARKEIVRSGHVWVGVSAQWVGVASTAPVRLPGAPGALRTIDPVRYASLIHPGDSYSYDIFSQAGRALRQPRGADPLRGGRIQALVALGESQSASRMVTYINAVHPLAKVYDGFFVHSRSNSAAPLSQPLSGRDAGPASPGPTTAIGPALGAGVPIRADTQVPVFVVQAETDVSNSLLVHRADDPRFRLWELTGTAHADAHLLSQGRNEESLTEAFCDAEATAALDVVPVNAGPHTFGVRAALQHLQRWVREGIAPPIGARIELADGAIARDPSTGIARGGVRLPQVDAPKWTLRGDRAADGNSLCFLFGRTDPWNGDADPWDRGPADPSPTPEPDLSALYPSHDVYVSRFEAATDAAVNRGHVLAADRDELVARARAADIGAR